MAPKATALSYRSREAVKDLLVKGGGPAGAGLLDCLVRLAEGWR